MIVLRLVLKKGLIFVIVVSLMLLIVWFLNGGDSIIIASGFFAIASSIDGFSYKYFKRGDEK